MTKIELLKEKKNIGDADTQYIDENKNKIAALFRNTNGIGYCIFFYPDDLKHIVINDIGSQMKALAVIEKTLIDNGYEVTNKIFNLY